MTTPDGRTFDYTYDIMGRLIAEDRPDGAQVDYSYDANGNVTAILNPNNIEHGFSYTANDQRESYNTPESGSYVYQYDRDRRLKSVMYPSGATITNTWATGQLQSTSTPEGLISYGYDCGGKLGSVSKGGESSSYTYDGSLLLTDTRAGTMNALIDYTYNSDLQVDSIGYAGAYESFVYDNDGLLTDAGAYSITRDAANGLPESVTDGTVTQWRDFSSYGEVDGVDYTVSVTAPYSWSVVRDNVGRITQKVENIGVDTVTWDYTYDLMGRLETVYKDSIMAEAYSYDGQGNRLEETNVLRGVSRTYTYDDEDKIVYAGLDFYQYDVDGFLTSRSIASGANSGITTFDYSSRGELLSATLPDSTVISYDHDPMGRRVAKRINGVITEKYLWQDATTLIAVYDGADNLIQRFEYADGRMPVAMTSAGAVYYLAYDQVGSLKVVTDAAGTIVKRVDYDSFGNILSDSNPTFSVPLGFAGGLHDRDTGLVRFGARDYDPATGKWTAKDPIDFAGGDLNLGGYCLQDPINHVDVRGLYRRDVHFTMTYQWALGVGLSPELALQIACANQGTDEDPDTQPIIWGMPFHFRNRGEIIPKLNMALLNGDPISFGFYLHQLQDSYSHAGFHSLMEGELGHFGASAKSAIGLGKDPDVFAPGSLRDSMAAYDSIEFLKAFQSNLNRPR